MFAASGLRAETLPVMKKTRTSASKIKVEKRPDFIFCTVSSDDAETNITWKKK
jgi:hypothetical protein